MVVEQGVRPGRRRRIYIGAALALLLAGVGTATVVGFSGNATPPGHQQTGDEQNAQQIDR